MADGYSSETQPLIGDPKRGASHRKTQTKTSSFGSLSKSMRSISVVTLEGSLSGFKLKRQVTLCQAIAIIVGCVIGSGIFISSKGVAEKLDSVGATLLIWTATGAISLCVALCYAELGASFPQTGGEFAFLLEIFGTWAAFLCGWIQIVVNAPCSYAAITKTAAIYLVQPLGFDCNAAVLTLIGLILIWGFVAVNIYSVAVSVHLQTVLSVAKILALAFIIVVGIVRLSQGYTEEFVSPFSGTTSDASMFVLALLDGIYAYKGWELVAALPEDMKNPKRDLLLSFMVGLTVITLVYILTNAAYFTALSPQDMRQSTAVALSFADRALPGTSWIMSIFVFLSCTGTLNGASLTDTRYLLAAGRTKCSPKVMSMLHLTSLAPVPAIIILGILTSAFSFFPFLEDIVQLASISTVVKWVMCLAALLYFRWKNPTVPRTFKLPVSFICVMWLLSVCLLVMSIYSNPLTIGLGLAMMALGVPIYFLVIWLATIKKTSVVMHHITVLIQKILLVAPTTSPD